VYHHWLERYFFALGHTMDQGLWLGAEQRVSLQICAAGGDNCIEDDEDDALMKHHLMDVVVETNY
jgi:hypothetical protein